MAKRWAVALRGHRFDLEDARMYFSLAGGRFQVATISPPHGEAVTVLVSREFDVLDRVEDVRQLADAFVDQLNGVLFVSNPHRGPLCLSGVHECHEGVWGHATISGAMSSVGRSRFIAIATVVNADGTTIPPEPPKLSRQAIWLQLAATDDDVRDVLTFMKAKSPTWFDLYKAWEHLRRSEKESWWDKERSGHFSGSAQFDRHAFGNHESMPSNKRMSIEEARTFIRWSAERWLEWRAES